MAREHIAQCRVFFDGRSVGGETIRERAILIDLAPRFLAFSDIMRFVIEVVIIGVVISLGWSKPFKDWADQANRTITSTLHDVGSKLQKHQDPSVKRP